LTPLRGPLDEDSGVRVEDLRGREAAKEWCIDVLGRICECEHGVVVPLKTVGPISPTGTSLVVFMMFHLPG
jgi:hypothetical protein